jgi:myo-inositol-1(or 4)-monophosphatase
MDLDLACKVAVAAARAAGALILDGAAGKVEEVVVSAKGSGGDVVTSLEPSAESCIVHHIRSTFPSHCIATEESGPLDGADKHHTWVVDPLDGSNNVAIGLHAFVVGIALCEHELPVLGVVHDPVAGETWTAIRDRGAVMRAVARDLADCGPVIAWTQGHGVARNDPTARSLRFALESRSRRVLQTWAPLVSWVMLARGAIDGFVGYCPEPWEMPAGTLLAREAGVAIVGLDGSRFDDRLEAVHERRSFVAGPPEMIGDLLDWAREGEAIRKKVATLLPGR